MLQILFAVYKFDTLVYHFETLCGVKSRQAPELTWNEGLHVVFVTNREINADGFFLTYERVNGKLSSHYEQYPDSQYPY